MQQNEALEGYQAHKAGQIERREEARGERERRERVCVPGEIMGNHQNYSFLFNAIWQPLKYLRASLVA